MVRSYKFKYRKRIVEFLPHNKPKTCFNKKAEARGQLTPPFVPRQDARISLKKILAGTMYIFLEG